VLAVFLATALTLPEASRLALQQASSYQQALTEERSAELDLTQARAALLPKVRDSFTATYNKPLHPGSEEPAFIAQNAAREYQNLLGVEGSYDFGMRAAVARARALLAAAHAGTEIARRALVRGVREAYYGYALAGAKRRSADEALAAAQEFERVTALQAKGGEVPEVDAVRARLQTAQRRDDAEQARVEETIAAATLRALVGYAPAQALTVEEMTAAPGAAEIERYAAPNAQRPELVQAQAQLTAARADVDAAHGARLPALTYSADEGFDSPSLHASDIRQHRGYLVAANVNVPIYDWGVARAKQRQAELRAQSVETQLAIVRRQLDQEFLAARETALAAVRRVENARAAMADAQRNVDISIARYRAGEAPIVEVTDALTTLAQQRANYGQALFDYEMARARLQEAAGE
jgi:outer membrane protein TolC